VEAASGVEPENDGVADRRLASWLYRLIFIHIINRANIRLSLITSSYKNMQYVQFKDSKHYVQ
jgi:hypothetical protein